SPGRTSSPTLGAGPLICGSQMYSPSRDPSNKISLLVKSCSIRACPERVQRVERVKQKSVKIGKFFAAFPQAGVSCTAREGIGSGVWLGKWESSCRSPCTKATAPSRLIAPMKSFAPAKIIAIQIVRDRRLGNPDARRADRRLSVCSLEPLRQASRVHARPDERQKNLGSTNRE